MASTPGERGIPRAMWEARDLTQALAQRHGLSYTHIGNAGSGRTDSRANKATPRARSAQRPCRCLLPSVSTVVITDA
ncbi:hypothetical protein [Mycobacterium sp.]|uniref:hypothetical protein n=1 Tax=Mycobacterium sp. TaxID=1785 RepID=UPI003F99B7BA